MSVMATAKLIEIVSAPAESFSESSTPLADIPNLVCHKLTWRFGKVTGPDRVIVTIATTLPPVPGLDGSRVFFYEPRNCVITAGGVKLHDYEALGHYTLSHDIDDPRFVRNLDLAVRTLNTPVDRAPNHAGI